MDMERVTKVLTVQSMESEPPYVRVIATFNDGGSPSRDSVRSEVSFFVNSFHQPKIGDELVMIIRPKTEQDQHTPMNEWTA